jgi:uncharacterized membrane protein YesL
MDTTGWTGTTMLWLRWAAQLVAVNILCVVGVLLGLGVLGVLPATRAAAQVLAPLTRGRPSTSLLPNFWDGYRTDFWRTNLLGLPFWAVGALTWVNLRVLRAAAVQGDATGTVLLVPIVVAATAAGVSLAFLAAVGLRRRDSVWATWRFVAVAPFVSPATSLCLVLSVGSFWTATLRWPVLVPLVGVSAPIFLGTWLAGRRLDRLLGDGPAEERHLDAPPPGPRHAAA